MKLGRIAAIAGIVGGLALGVANPGSAQASAVPAAASSARSVQCTVYGGNVTLGFPSTVYGHTANCRLNIG
jgi:hypothetical protein